MPLVWRQPIMNLGSEQCLAMPQSPEASPAAVVLPDEFQDCVDQLIREVAEVRGLPILGASHRRITSCWRWTALLPLVLSLRHERRLPHVTSPQQSPATQHRTPSPQSQSFHQALYSKLQSTKRSGKGLRRCVQQRSARGSPRGVPHNPTVFAVPTKQSEQKKFLKGQHLVWSRC
jgi:hypothetical protein